MKNLFKTTVLMSALLLLALGSFAQSQLEAIKTISMGEPYNVYTVKGTSGNYVVSPKPSSNPMYFFLENEGDLRRIQLKRNWSGDRRALSLDEIGHSATLILGGLIDLPNLKYIRGLHEDVRMVIIGETIYSLDDYKGPNDYRIEYIIKKGKTKGKSKGFRAMLKESKAQLKALKNSDAQNDMPQVDHEKIINEYLKRELAIQKVEAPKWKAANKDYYDRIAADQREWDRLKGVEYKKLAKFAWVKNTSTSTIWFTTGNGSPIQVKVGGLKRLPCDLAPMYKSNAQGDKRALLFNPAKYCGKTFTVSSW